MSSENTLKVRWQKLASRIDALSLRERVFLFLCVAVVLAAMLDTLLISPLSAEQVELRQHQQRQASELTALREQYSQATQLNATGSPQAKLRADIAQVQAEQLQLDQQLKQNSGLLDNTSQLPDVLGQLLRQHARLSLVKLNTIDETLAAQAAGTVQGTLKWRGVELSVAGDYLDLMRYLADLERGLPSLRWGSMHISSEQGHALLQVQVFLVGGTT